jgi:hypothetical protein
MLLGKLCPLLALLATFVVAQAVLLHRARTLQDGHVLTQLGLMAHLCGVLSDTAPAVRPARTTALAAIAALCAHQPQAQANFFQYGGVNTLLATLLQPEHADEEARGALTLFETVLAPLPECRDIMESARGMEVLAQVHRDAEAKGDEALRRSTVMVLAQLTFRCARMTGLGSLLSTANNWLHARVLVHAFLSCHPFVIFCHSCWCAARCVPFAMRG